MYEKIKQQFSDLEKKMAEPEIINNPESLKKISREYSDLKEIIELILKLEKNEKDIKDNEEIVEKEEGDLKEMAREELEKLIKESEKLKTDIEDALHPADPNDKKNCLVEIRAGTGGDESALFAAELFRMYARFAENQGWKVEILDSNRTGIGGFKEIIFAVKGQGAYGLLKYEAGTHRVQRVPETEKQGRIHTSTATVVVLPEAEEVDIEIKPADIRIDTFCSSGPGGQSVNTTYSAIRILHLPTGLIVSCQDQKSQHQNKEKALQVLRSRLLARQEEEQMAANSSARKDQIGAGDRSDKIRTYNFPQDRMTDHRVGQSWHNLNGIMDGDLEEVVKTIKKASRSENI